MSSDSGEEKTAEQDRDEAVVLLQQLGLKEYEAKCFVALSRLPKATAKEISEISAVPRTRVYDATRVLESKGLVEVQHSNPQEFRAVSIDEAIETLQQAFASRTESLRRSLEGMQPATVGEGEEVTHEVWALSSTSGITTRTGELMDSAEREVVFVVGDESVFTARVATHLQEALDRGVSVIVGTISESLRETVQERLPDAEVYVSGLEWLGSSALAEDHTAIGRILLADRESILVSTFVESGEDGLRQEHAVFGRGFDNGLVAIVRRLMATGLLPGVDPGME